ncbi:FKBP-type peptidyl-prolyl cis-trans isomerases 1 [Hahella chejuensis KCTC 2396]|uniref:Peptidyl-prolyl cis-trans isomerase n=1 Tax=Hahella chejuensis (strain KCTC 2396) TaxID=349521 RepID=Q2SQ83_HAHCH|nr:FKBP-type peptidyl-prolyl cis-trans isomerase [Hahella chejuensis]ABC27191.1 FKBP-type peptidyl-prolyl cis-trans isomerases 1 [Hahella chejuensis KCTC 2396]
MKKALASMSGLLCAVALSLPVAVHAETEKLTNDAQKTGYSFGQMFGRRLADSMPELDIESFTKGVADAYAGKPSMMTDEEISAQVQQYQQAMQKKQMEQFEKMAEENAKKGDTFLADNAKKEGIVTTDSGLQYKVLKAGEGDSPKAQDTVEVHYTGSLINGEVFDSSVQRGEPVSFPVNGVIPGWTEALQLMKPGAKWQLFIPAKLAYGPGGNGRIGPNETLLFEVELLSVKSEKSDG